LHQSASCHSGCGISADPLSTASVDFSTGLDICRVALVGLSHRVRASRAVPGVSTTRGLSSMDSSAHHWPRLMGVFSVVLLLAFSVSLPGARASSRGGGNRGVLPPSSEAFGKSYGAWSGAWWQYVFSQPASSNPLVDPTGAHCRAGQSGRVFFLVGTNGGGTATRDQCIVPAGKALFFPLVNAFDVHVPGDGLDTPQKVWDDLHVTIGFGPFSELHATIDGVAVGNLTPSSTPYHACAGPVAGCAPPFSLTFPADNFFGLPAGTYEPAVADGFYLMLAPLPPGPHTINFGGTGLFGESSFSEEITYHLVVAAG